MNVDKIYALSKKILKIENKLYWYSEIYENGSLNDEELADQFRLKAKRAKLLIKLKKCLSTD